MISELHIKVPSAAANSPSTPFNPDRIYLVEVWLDHQDFPLLPDTEILLGDAPVAITNAGLLKVATTASEPFSIWYEGVKAVLKLDPNMVESIPQFIADLQTSPAVKEVETHTWSVLPDSP